ncbi:vacuolar sorting [Scheffersomyces stipitis CBS 6054]|uniref:Vacuolar protein sorting-associated protein n=1 Tax=Scheffersomyces stipitis (strain ATCC 58785 / CBS 6054 / NBRC 10063 / NRRL Y-11545) TaxID=322104 RepID=A3GH59_PICST|nr:vacuolar sorting [Scheffersomyces stipitis CBS 6054]EAZ62765.2 vacuolar sorting [Scheffersomyces stipitis CBS 6054]
MFESLVANLVNRFLGSYIENFDAKQLNIGIWSGDVKLKNLKLKKESLDKFKLPVDVKFGHLGELTLQIPWSNLKSKPVRVIIEDVYLLASPKIIKDFDIEEDNRRELELKKQRLENLEAIQSVTSQAQDGIDTAQNETFTESLITKIVDNLQVTIKNIHIRYEDDSVLAESPYALGISLNELSAVSTDEGWKPSFIEITQTLTRKLLTLKYLSCYMNTESSSIYTDNYEDLLNRFKESIITDQNYSIDLQFLIKPVSGGGKITLNKAGSTEAFPHIRAELSFKSFRIELDSQQYRDILWTASKFHWYTKTHKFRKFRPKVTVEEDPKQWFQYAAKSVLNEIHERNYKWSWEYFAKRRDQRKAYIKLWKAKLSNNMTTDQKYDLSNLETLLPFEDIKFYRSLARSELRKQNAISLASESGANNPQNTSYGGWISSWWGTAPAADASANNTIEEKTEADESKLELSLTDDQRKALYDAIDYDENQEIIDSIDLPKDRVKLEVFTSLEEGGITIRRRTDEQNLAEVVFEGCTAQFYQRPDSFLAKFQLQEFRVEDGTGTTLYKHIVSVKQMHSHLHEDSNVIANDPFFQMSFENNPLDESADSILLGKLKSMTIFYNPMFIEEVARFFRPPKIHLDTVGAIMNAAEATVEGLTAQTRIGLQYALEEHKTINVKLDLQAPLIIVPLDPSNFKSPVAILDAGHISVVSNLVDKAIIEEVRSKESYTEDDWKKLNTLMYDQFNVHLQDAQFLVGPNIKSTMEQLHSETSKGNSLMLDKLNIKLLLGISILPDAHNLAKFKVSGEVPEINLAINDFQYKTIMQIIDASLPNFDEFDGEESSVFEAFGTRNGSVEIEDTDKTNMDSKQIEAISKQHIFEFSFNVQSVNISLSRCINGHTLQTEPLVDLVGDYLSLNFYNTQKLMHLDLILDDINLIDHIERSGVPEFARLISSNNFTDEEIVNKEIFKLDYWRTQRIVEYNDKEIEVFDQDIKMDIATVKFVVSRKSLLSLLNFVLNTFTDPNAEATPADELKHNDSRDDEVSPQKINVKINLDSIILVLNEDGLKLATLKLSTADISVFLVPEEMEVNGKLGALSLHDEINQGSPRDSLLRNLISMEGDNLAEFVYKTFDREISANTYNTFISFNTGAIAINFVESSLNRILSYLSQFLKMKAIYDKARDAAINQAGQIDDANKIKFDLLIKAPTIIFPTLVKNSNMLYDTVSASLGELYAYNEFKESNGIMKNIISTGIRKVNLLSLFHFEKNCRQKSKIVDNFDVSFLIDYNETYVKDIPTFIINGRMPALDLNLTELQLKKLLSLSDSVLKVFNFPDASYTFDDIEIDAENANAVIRHDTTVRNANVTTKPIKLDVHESQAIEIPPEHRNVELKFEVPSISLKIYNRTFGIEDIEKKRLASFSLNKFDFDFDMREDGHFTSNFSVGSFVVSDIRENTDSKFRELIPPISGDNDQFVLSVTTDGPAEKKNITAMLTIEKPSTILVLDYLFELKAFFDKGFEKDSSMIVDYAQNREMITGDRGSISGSAKIDNSPGPQPSSSNIGFSINVKEPSVILLADSSKEDTEAIVFKVEQVLVASQNVISLAANNIGLFLTAMNDFDDTRYRIIDDFSVSFAHDSNGSTSTSFLTNIQASVDPMIVRVSLRDIRLALDIFNHVNELYSKAHADQTASQESDYNLSEDFKRRLSKYAPSILTSLSAKSLTAKEAVSIDNATVVKGEELVASIGGVRFVLIGDVHELPVLDMNVKPFEVRAINWSTDLNAEVHIEQFVNIYNYARSTWEPLIEPWPIAIYASNVLTPQKSLLVEVVSRQLAEITLTSHSVALLSQISSLITSDQRLKLRGEDNPYLIVNETGFDLEVWSDSSDDTRENRRVIKSHDKLSWSFEDWRDIRENLDTNNKVGILGVRLLNSQYEIVNGISATGEGEELFILYPPVDGVHNRLSCDIALGDDNVKTILFKSTVRVENDADVPIIVKVMNDNATEELVIESKKGKALPIDFVYASAIKIRPYIDTPYEWSDRPLHWKDLIKNEVSLKCSAVLSNDLSSFYFQAEAIYDHEEPLARIYPHLRLVISAPVEIENLLPFDLNYRLYDKNLKKDWKGSVDKGIKSYVHVVSLENLLLLSVEPKNCNFGKSEFAIINISKASEFKRENTLILRSQDGQQLKLRIYYPRKKSNSTSLRVVIYSPYVILNRTGQNLLVDEKGNSTYSYGKSSLQPVIPVMFSFDRFGDRQNRAQLKIGDSAFTAPISFDALGQDINAKAQVPGRQIEMNVGISIAEGEGKYNLSKVVTIAPRYIVRNSLQETLQIVENGTTKQIQIGPKELLPLYGLRRLEKKSILIKFLHSSKTWSSPFTLDDIGQLFIKVYKENVGQVLLKVSIILENATMFIQIENANNNWPFSIRNFSDSEFYVYQNDPNINENGELVKNDTQYKPIYYKIPAKSVMPYAYDYPNAVIKELIIRSHGRERAVNLAEIGNLKPFRLPPTQDAEQSIVDLNVVADGPTQSLIITNYDPSVSLYKLPGEKSSSTVALSQNFEASEGDENYHIKIVTKFEGFGLSLINTRFQELCYITIRGLELRYNESDLYQNISFKLKWMQIDNQLYGGIFPIIQYPSVIPKSGRELNSHPSLSGSLVRVKDDSHGVLFIKYATILLQEMTFEIDEDFLFALLEFAKFPGASWNKESVDKLCDAELKLPEPGSLTGASDIYFEALHLQPIQLNLSFVRTERVNAEDKASSQNTLMFFFNVLTMAIGNINDAPIKLNSLFIENLRVPIPILIESIQTHYGQSFFYQVHKILGSADFIGNPVGLFNHISSGVLDIFYEPYQGFIINDRPQELGISIAKGGLSFVKKSIFGFSDSFAKFTGSIAKGLSVATMDKNFQERRRLNQRRNKPKHALYGVASGANSFFESVSSGVTGIATAPIEGANAEGAAGFFKGLGRGVVGLPTKTAIGFFDLASNVSEGIRNTTTVFDAEGLDKVRLPRHIPHDHVIRPFSQREAQGQYWLNSIDGDVYFRETYLAHLLLSGEEKVVLVTYKMIVLFEVNNLKSKWVISFDQIKSISVEPSGLSIGLKRREGPFIPIPEKKNRNFLYNKIAIAVEEFNKHCQIVL